MATVKLSILTNDTVTKRNFLAEHGLSLFIETKGFKILFDTGQSDVFSKNASNIGIKLAETNCIVLSHGHYDHCGGMEYFKYKMPNVYVHNNAFINHYTLNNNNTYKDIGIPWSQDFKNKIKHKIKHIQNKTSIADGIFVCGEIPSTEEFEGVPQGFYTEDNNQKSYDIFKDEAVLVVDTEKGLCVFLGCSHTGVVNCIKQVKRLFPDKNIYMVAGGMHLLKASEMRILMTIQYIINEGIEKIIPLHCTGLSAICEMKKHFKDKCEILYVGNQIEI
ncbi:MAG: MBL fold metallo-hydrolase [Clostridiales bacterium]|nr:MBL fold metallo-hydrolase [Clostridiales bacterium]